MYARPGMAGDFVSARCPWSRANKSLRIRGLDQLLDEGSALRAAKARHQIVARHRRIFAARAAHDVVIDVFRIVFAAHAVEQGVQESDASIAVVRRSLVDQRNESRPDWRSETRAAISATAPAAVADVVHRVRIAGDIRHVA